MLEAFVAGPRQSLAGRLRPSKHMHLNCANLLQVALFPVHEKRPPCCQGGLF
jgi:hypothetical protein